MIYVIGLVLAAVSFGLVYYPLARGRPLDEGDSVELPGENGHRSDLVARRESAYEAIKELEFEHELGNLSEQDYRELRERYKWRAAEVLQALDELAAPASVPGSLEDEPEDFEPDGPAETAAGTCPECETPARSGSQFCARCGAPLVRTCSECGELASLDDHFCASCGAPLSGGDDE